VLYLYGITDASALPQPLPPGLEDRAVDILPLDGMAAVTGELEQGRPEPTEQHLRAHFRVVEAFVAGHTILPVRFGTAFVGLPELKAHLERAHGYYSNDLQRLRGQIEVGIKALRRGAATCASGSDEAPIPADAGPGARYLAGKRAQAAQSLSRQRQVKDLAELLMKQLGVPASLVEWREASGAAGEIGVSAAFLLPRERLRGFEHDVSALRALEPELDILLTGPWPPYSFVSPPEVADALS
jgi:Gas vesicle synthesis protein GvpL/GvpF